MASWRVFYIYSGNDVSISGVTIRHGNTSTNGGGIRNEGGTLTLTNSTVSGNTSSGNSGGGIYNILGTLTLVNTTVSDNRADFYGGGIHNHKGTLIVTNSTVSGNIVGTYGGGISNYIGTATLTNVTVNGNSSGYYGGGIWNYVTSTLTLANSIIVSNSGSSGPDCYGARGTSLGHNLIGTSGCIFELSTDDISGTDPKLGLLKDNGGPTWTHALLTGSPAIDTGNPAIPDSETNACPDKDQRGITRPQGGNGDGTARCDIGAYELKP